MRALAIILILILAGRASANPSVCAVITESGAGSCTYIGDGIFITNNHVVDDVKKAIIVDSTRGVSYLARVIGTSEQDDLAALKTEHVVLTPPAKIASRGVSKGQTVHAYGYGESYHDDDHDEVHKRHWTGRVHGFAMIHGDDHQNVYGFNNKAISGDSGGGVFNASGELIGPLFATDGKNTYAIRNQELRDFLRTIR